jgi:hypothetical protein
LNKLQKDGSVRVWIGLVKVHLELVKVYVELVKAYIELVKAYIEVNRNISHTNRNIHTGPKCLNLVACVLNGKYHLRLKSPFRACYSICYHYILAMPHKRSRTPSFSDSDSGSDSSISSMERTYVCPKSKKRRHSHRSATAGLDKGNPKSK